MPVVVVGSINIDTRLELSHLPAPGETLRALSSRASLGGKGANQAVAAAVAGAATRFVGAAGPDGDDVLSRLAGAGLEIDVERTPAPTGGALVLVDASGENSIVLTAGANDRLEAAHIRRALSGVGAGDVVVLQGEVPARLTCTAAAIARAAGARVLWNAAPAPLQAADVVRDLDLLVVNEVELEQIARLVGVTLDDPSDTANAVARSLACDVVCTLGARGALWIAHRDGASGRVAAPTVDAVDTTGAGDTLVGYLAALAHLPLPERLRIAAVAGAIAVTRPGAAESVPTLDETLRMLADAPPEPAPRLESAPTPTSTPTPERTTA